MGIKIKKGDTVIVIAGKDKGQTGEVKKIILSKWVTVSGVNKAKRHQKPNPSKERPGAIVEKEMPLHLSKIALLNPITKKADRVGFKFLEDGRKVRYFKSNNEVIE